MKGFEAGMSSPPLGRTSHEGSANASDSDSEDEVRLQVFSLTCFFSCCLFIMEAAFHAVLTVISTVQELSCPLNLAEQCTTRNVHVNINSS